MTTPTPLVIPRVPLPGEPPLKMLVDTEHFGIRIMMTVFAFGGLGLGFVIGQVLAAAIDPTFSSLCLAIPLAIVAMVGLTQLGERVIKPRWTSGRTVYLDSAALQLEDRRRGARQETIIRWLDGVDVQAWYFPVTKRRTRVQRGWLCTSIQLRQGDQTIMLYAFLNPAVAQAMPRFKDWFVRLRKRKELDALQTFDPRLSVQMTRLRQLEGERWRDGAELSGEHFLAVMSMVEHYGRQGT
jgi:hypothetical protein